jgi:hypothetical protein
MEGNGFDEEDFYITFFVLWSLGALGLSGVTEQKGQLSFATVKGGMTESFITPPPCHRHVACRSNARP